MASDGSQDFSTDTTPANQQNKYGFSSLQNHPVPMYPPIPGYFSPPTGYDNPLQELQTMGFKDMRYTEIPGSASEPFGFELRLEGVDKVFTGLGAGKKKVVANQFGLIYLKLIFLFRLASLQPCPLWSTSTKPQSSLRGSKSSPPRTRLL